MSRSIRVSLGLALVALVVGISFAGGRYLRKHTGPGGPFSGQVAAVGGTRLGTSGPGSAGQIVLADPRDLFLQVQQHVEQDYVDPIRDYGKLGSGAVRTMLAALDDPKTRYYDPDQRKALERQMNGEYAGIGATLAIVRGTRNGGKWVASGPGKSANDPAIDALDTHPEPAAPRQPQGPAGKATTPAPSPAPNGGVEQRRLVIQAPVAGGPAAKAGIRAGDVVTEIDGKWVIAYDPRQDLDRLRVRSMTDDQYRKAELDARKRLIDGLALPRAIEMLTTGTGKEIKLTVERPGVVAPMQIAVKTTMTTIDAVTWRQLDPTTACLRVSLLNDAAAATIQAELKRSKHRNLILDLRDNTGGPVTTLSSGAMGAAVALVGQLEPGSPAMSLIRKGNKRDVIRVPAATVKKRRIMVLVNYGTGNLAEAVVSGLKERGATVIGTRTFGDGTLQKYYRLQNGGAMTVNAGRLASPRDVQLAGVGVQPTIALPMVASSPGDAAMDRAVAEIARTARTAR